MVDEINVETGEINGKNIEDWTNQFIEVYSNKFESIFSRHIEPLSINLADAVENRNLDDINKLTEELKGEIGSVNRFFEAITFATSLFDAFKLLKPTNNNNYERILKTFTTLLNELVRISNLVPEYYSRYFAKIKETLEKYIDPPTEEMMSIVKVLNPLNEELEKSVNSVLISTKVILDTNYKQLVEKTDEDVERLRMEIVEAKFQETKELKQNLLRGIETELGTFKQTFNPRENDSRTREIESSHILISDVVGKAQEKNPVEELQREQQQETERAEIVERDYPATGKDDLGNVQVAVYEIFTDKEAKKLEKKGRLPSKKHSRRLWHGNVHVGDEETYRKPIQELVGMKYVAVGAQVIDPTGKEYWRWNVTKAPDNPIFKQEPSKISKLDRELNNMKFHSGEDDSFSFEYKEVTQTLEYTRELLGRIRKEVISSNHDSNLSRSLNELEKFVKDILDIYRKKDNSELRKDKREHFNERIDAVVAELKNVAKGVENQIREVAA